MIPQLPLTPPSVSGMPHVTAQPQKDVVEETRVLTQAEQVTPPGKLMREILASFPKQPPHNIVEYKSEITKIDSYIHPVSKKKCFYCTVERTIRAQFIDVDGRTKTKVLKVPQTALTKTEVPKDETSFNQKLYEVGHAVEALESLIKDTATFTGDPTTNPLMTQTFKQNSFKFHIRVEETPALKGNKVTAEKEKLPLAAIKTITLANQIIHHGATSKDTKQKLEQYSKTATVELRSLTQASEPPAKKPEKPQKKTKPSPQPRKIESAPPKEPILPSGGTVEDLMSALKKEDQKEVLRLAKSIDIVALDKGNRIKLFEFLLDVHTMESSKTAADLLQKLKPSFDYEDDRNECHWLKDVLKFPGFATQNLSQARELLQKCDSRGAFSIITELQSEQLELFKDQIAKEGLLHKALREVSMLSAACGLIEKAPLSVLTAKRKEKTPLQILFEEASRGASPKYLETAQILIQRLRLLDPAIQISKQERLAFDKIPEGIRRGMQAMGIKGLT
jgi:hypothetical protein